MFCIYLQGANETGIYPEELIISGKLFVGNPG